MTTEKYMQPTPGHPIQILLALGKGKPFYFGQFGLVGRIYNRLHICIFARSLVLELRIMPWMGLRLVHTLPSQSLSLLPFFSSIKHQLFDLVRSVPSL